MRIFLENKSYKTLIINLNGQQKLLPPLRGDSFVFEGSRISMNLTTDDSYSTDKYSEAAGYNFTHRFITQSLYDFTVSNDFSVELYVETKKGDHFESYQRVVPYCKDFSFPKPIYTLKNECEVREKFAQNDAFADKVEKRADLFARIDKADTIISNIVFWVLSLGLSVIIFIAIWSVFSLKAAIITIAALALISQLIYRIIKKLIDGIGKTADKVLSSKAFDKAIDKVNDKFVYCKDMPEGLYKDENSYFDPIYISAVFKYSTKSV